MDACRLRPQLFAVFLRQGAPACSLQTKEFPMKHHDGFYKRILSCRRWCRAICWIMFMPASLPTWTWQRLNSSPDPSSPTISTVARTT